MNKTQNNLSNIEKQNKEAVLILCSNRWNSAITEYSLNTAMALADKDLYEVSLVGLKDSFLTKRAKTNRSISVLEVESFSFRAFWKIKKIFSTKKPRHVFAIEGKEYLVVCLIKLFLADFRLYRFFGYNIDIERKFFGLKIQSIFTEAYFFPCEWLLTKFKNKNFKNLHKIDLGLNLPALDISEKFDNQTSSERKSLVRALIFGRLDPVKGHREFLRIWKKFISFAQSINSKQKFELHIYGKEENTKIIELENTCINLGLKLQQDIFFKSEQFANVSGLMREFDLGIVPSLSSEVVLRVAQEFLWNGVPILVSNVNTLAEVIRSDEDGVTFSYECTDQELMEVFTKCLDLIGKDTNTLKANRSFRAQNVFGLDRMASSIFKMMKDL